MRAQSLEELQVYQKALEGSDAVSAMGHLAAFAADLRLRTQLWAASERVASVIAEGFAQRTDRHFAHYLYTAKGSSAETRTQLRIAMVRGYISKDALATTAAKYIEIEKMLTGLIKHLNRENRKDRGTHGASD